MDDKEEELEQRYQDFLQRQKNEEAKKGLTNIPAPTEGTNFSDPENKRAELTVALARAKVKQNLLDVFHIDFQIAHGNEKDLATNKKLRYEFAKEFIRQHWAACIDAKIKIKDLLNV